MVVVPSQNSYKHAQDKENNIGSAVRDPLVNAQKSFNFIIRAGVYIMHKIYFFSRLQNFLFSFPP